MSTAPADAAQKSQPQPMIYPARPAGRAGRVFIFYSLALLLTALVSMLFADLLWRSGWNNGSTILLVLFILLFLLISIGCMHGIAGFILRALGDPDRITRLGDYTTKSIDGVSTAIVFPIDRKSVV